MEENLHHENTLLFANENDLQKISIGRLPNVINELTNAMQTSGSPLSPDKMLKCVRLRSQCHVRVSSNCLNMSHACLGNRYKVFIKTISCKNDMYIAFLRRPACMTHTHITFFIASFVRY